MGIDGGGLFRRVSVCLIVVPDPHALRVRPLRHRAMLLGLPIPLAPRNRGWRAVLAARAAIVTETHIAWCGLVDAALATYHDAATSYENALSGEECVPETMTPSPFTPASIQKSRRSNESAAFGIEKLAEGGGDTAEVGAPRIATQYARFVRSSPGDPSRLGRHST